MKGGRSPWPAYSSVLPLLHLFNRNEDSGSDKSEGESLSVPECPQLPGRQPASGGRPVGSGAQGKGTRQLTTASPPQTSFSAFAWQVSGFKSSKLPLREALAARPPSTTSPQPSSPHPHGAENCTNTDRGPDPWCSTASGPVLQGPAPHPATNPFMALEFQRQAPKEAMRQD